MPYIQACINKHFVITLDRLQIHVSVGRIGSTTFLSYVKSEKLSKPIYCFSCGGTLRQSTELELAQMKGFVA